MPMSCKSRRRKSTSKLTKKMSKDAQVSQHTSVASRTSEPRKMNKSKRTIGSPRVKTYRKTAKTPETVLFLMKMKSANKTKLWKN